jgi:protein MAK11
VYDWQCVHILGGHKDTIHDFSIHPTGKMALSVSKDHTLKLWNLVQGGHACLLVAYLLP